MYIMKISKANQLVHVLHFESFQNAIACIADKAFLNNLPNNQYISASGLGRPQIIYGGISNRDNLPDDFEFRYENGVRVYVGTILTEEEMERSNTKS